MSRRIAVYGATGHTGRQVADALVQRGWSVFLIGRDPVRLAALAARLHDAEPRTASIDDASALDRALEGAAALINCAGPFRDTAPPLIAAALRARIPYLDVAAEIEAVLDTLKCDDQARAVGITIVPAMAFYGGLGDLLATDAMGDWKSADEIVLAYGLNEWVPTAGTRAAGAVSRERRGGKRPVFTGGALAYRDGPLPAPEDWDFPPPIRRAPAIADLTIPEPVPIPSHLAVPEIRSYMAARALAGLTADETRPADGAEPADSAQIFALEVIVRRDGEERRRQAIGGDIYAITAPLVAEAAAIVVQGGGSGVRTAGEIGTRGQLLRAIAPSLDRLR